MYVCAVSFYIILYFTKSLSNKFHRAFVFSRACFFFYSFMQIRYGYGITVPGTAALLPVRAGFE